MVSSYPRPWKRKLKNLIAYRQHEMRRILNVAEKPSAAKSIAQILSRGSARTVMSKSKYNPIYEFNYQFQGENVQMSFTSVAGHVMGLEFEEKYSMKYWNSAPHENLFKTAIVNIKVSEGKEDLVSNLKNLSRTCQTIILWLDCDREGEAIAFEVLRICQEVNPRIQYFRAHFSALTDRDINQAMRDLKAPDPNLAAAVESRQEIDLRIGAAFTRYQTTLLKKKIPELSSLRVISYGPCQFPTLGFVVERFKTIQQFVPENFWYISVKHDKRSKLGETQMVEFAWARHHIFDEDVATVFYEKCLENKEATVVSVQGNPKSRFRPIPLSTVNMQKIATSKLRMDSHRVMEVAEKLYNKGFISYPRTETEIYTRTLNLEGLVQTQRQHPMWGNYAVELLEDGKFLWPRNGKNDDKAHPPIHPVKLATKDSHGLTVDEWRIYELVTRYFLACCSRDAVGFETIVKIDISKEIFQAKGLIIREYNWLEVYPYEKWTGNTLPLFDLHEKFIPKEIAFKQSRTTPPLLLTENELITQMDKNGIGTDATIHEHIKTIQERQYAEKQGIYFKPTKLGYALVEAYESTGSELWKPGLRAAMELNMTEISRGNMTKEVFLNGCLDQMEQIFRQMKGNETTILEVMKKHYDGVNMTADGGVGAGNDLNGINPQECRPLNDEEGMCGNCSFPNLKFLEAPNGTRIVNCPVDDLLFKMPRKGELSFKDATCPLCSFQVVEVKTENNSKYTLCPNCYVYPPQDLFPDIEEGSTQPNVPVTMPCFKCPKSDCALSGLAASGEKTIFTCPKCNNNGMRVKKGKNNNKLFLGCKGYPNCNHIIGVPEIVKDIEVLTTDCSRCGPGIKKVKLKFSQDEILPPTVQMRVIEEDAVFCLAGCDQDMEVLGYSLESRGGRGTSGGSYTQQSNSMNFENSRGGGNFSNNNSMGATQGSENVSNNSSSVSSFLAKYQIRQQQQQQQGSTSRPWNATGTQQPVSNVGIGIPSTPVTNRNGISPNKMDVCSKCKMVGHSVTNCPKMKPQQSQNGAFANFHNISAPAQNNSRGGGNRQQATRPGLSEMSWNDNNRNTSDLNSRNRNQEDGGGQASRNNNNNPNFKAGVTCYVCKEEGHFASSCPQKGQGGGGARGQAGGGGSYGGNSTGFGGGDGGNNNVKPGVTCYVCKEEGHFASSCPQKGQGGGGARGGGQQAKPSQYNRFNNDNSNNGFEEESNGGGGGFGGGSYGGAGGGGNSTFKAGITCYVCKEEGHFASSCPQKGQGGGARGQAGGGGSYGGNSTGGGFGGGAGGGGGNKDLSSIKCYKCNEMGHYASSCGQTQGGGGQASRGGQSQAGGNNFGSFNFGAANTNYTPSNNNRAMSNITNTGAGGNAKVCGQCGFQGARHPRGSNCPSIKRKQMKKNGGGDGGEYGADDY